VSPAARLGSLLILSCQVLIWLLQQHLYSVSTSPVPI
jgi:hypothetical protein